MRRLLVMRLPFPKVQAGPVVPQSRPSRWRRRAVLVLLGLAMALVAIEVALRVWTGLRNPAIYQLDAAIGWRHTPSLARTLVDETGRRVEFSTDARGLRATPHANAPIAGRRRVLFLGDSFTQGSQVEAAELFTSHVERGLLAAAVCNAGVGGYSTLQEWRALSPQLAAFAPDLVVLVVFENDFQDNLMPYFSGLGPRPYLQVRGSEVVVNEVADVGSFERFLMPAPAAMWCYEHCALYRALHKHMFLPRHGDALARLEAKERAALSEADQRTAMAWLLQRIATDVAAAKCSLLVAAIPMREMVQAASAPSHAWLAAQCGTLGVPFVSLLPALQRIGSERAFFAFDIHLTAAGHEAVSATLLPSVAAALRRRE